MSLERAVPQSSTPEHGVAPGISYDLPVRRYQGLARSILNMFFGEDSVEAARVIVAHVGRVQFSSSPQFGVVKNAVTSLLKNDKNAVFACSRHCYYPAASAGGEVPKREHPYQTMPRPAGCFGSMA